MSSVLIATRPAPPVTDPDVTYWVTLARRLLQRGTMPEIRCEPPLGTDLSSAGLLWALFPAQQGIAADSAFSLDPTYEAPFMKEVLRRFPDQATFLWPQAPFESAAADPAKRSRRWVDFLFAPPGARPVVFEIDGGQHDRSATVDRERDDALAELEIKTLRVKGAKSLASDGSLFAWVSRATPSDIDHAAVNAFRAPTDATRAVYGIIEAVAVGLLRPGPTWRVRAEPCSEATLFSTLDACAALDHVWSTGVMPATIEFVGRERAWLNPYPSTAVSENVDEVAVVVEWAPAWAPIEQPDEAAGVVVVRGVPLPVHAGWDAELSSERRPRESDAFPSDIEGRFFATEALEVLARFCFGVEAFRSGQVEAIRQILAGEDACVLLPTGHGKTLVYQVSLLLRPGLTLVVAPIVSLIDDQQKRFVSDGIDRVAAIQGARTEDPKEGDLLYGSIASGNALVSLLSPERMQIERFRDQLRHVAERRLVSLAVVDETHCVSEWGHDFRTSYLRLGRNIREVCKGEDGIPPPLLSLTGTASPGVLRDVLGELEIDGDRPGALQQPDSFDRANLHYDITVCSEDAEFETLRQVILEDIPAALGVEARALSELRGPDTLSGIVFVPWTKNTHGTEAVARAVRKFFEEAHLPVPGVGTYSGRNPRADSDRFDRDWASQKADTAERFKGNQLNILVATKAFGMGIDKPNIRWTVHLGIPSSIEAFAQEAGRAGRDKHPAQCRIVSAQRDANRTRTLLDLERSGRQRRLDFNRLHPRDDVGKQLFFFYNNFPGTEAGGFPPGGVHEAIRRVWVEGEAPQACDTWDVLRAAGAAPYGRVTIPRLVDGARMFKDRETFRGLRDKSLHRLSLVGVVDDVTIDYGADTVTVDFTGYNNEFIDRSLVSLADRVQPGRHRHHLEVIAGAPSDFDERVRHHVTYAVDLVYAVVEPARLTALREMWLLTQDDPDDERIRQTIAAYLGQGPMTTALAEIAVAPEIDIAWALRRLDASPPATAFEWAAAAGRQLETYPDHPLLLIVRAAGEALLPAGDEATFGEFLRRAAEQLLRYDVAAGSRRDLFAWLRHGLLNLQQGRRESWLEQLWSSWHSMEGMESLFAQISDEALADPDHHLYELPAVLAYRLRRLASDDLALDNPLETHP